MAEAVLAVDTSVAVPLLMFGHDAHAMVSNTVANQPLALPAHAQAETYSVITRLPGDARVASSDAVALITANFSRVLIVSDTTVEQLLRICADAGIAGGAIYDAMVALAARDHDVELLTRDRRAQATYAQLNVRFRLL